jgi:hypothetical protein
LIPNIIINALALSTIPFAEKEYQELASDTNTFLAIEILPRI